MKLVTLQVTASIPDNEDGDAMENALTEILAAHEWNASVTLIEVNEIDEDIDNPSVPL